MRETERARPAGGASSVPPTSLRLLPVAADVVAAVLAARGIWVLAHGDRAGILWIAAGVAVAVLSSWLLVGALRRRAARHPEEPSAGGGEVEAWEPR